MKFTLSTAVLALSLASVQAAPVVEKVTEAATVESRTLGLLSSLFGGSNCWWTGTSRTYKMRASCPDHPEVHNKYMNKRGDGTIGFEGSVDFQFSLDDGAWSGKSWGSHPKDSSSQDMCIVGKSGFKDIMPQGSSDKDGWSKSGGGGRGSDSPDQYGSYGGWWIDPLFPLLESLDIFGILSNRHFLQYQWGVGQNHGYDWICYKDSSSGYKIKYWDHKCDLDVSIKSYFVIKIEIVKESWWSKTW